MSEEAHREALTDRHGPGSVRDEEAVVCVVGDGEDDTSRQEAGDSEHDPMFQHLFFNVSNWSESSNGSED